MKSKIKNIIITFLLLICCTFTLVGCTNTNNTIMDIARQNGLNCIKSSKDYNSSNNNTNTAPSTTINVTNNNSNIDLNETYNALVTNGYSGSFSDFLKEYVFKDYSSTTSTEYAVNKSLLSVVSIVAEFHTYSYTITSSGIQTSLSQKTPYVSMSAGSGVVYTINKTDGSAYIITNFHVIYLSNGITNNYNYIKSDEGDGCIAKNIYCFMYGTNAKITDTKTTDENGFTIYNAGASAIKCEYVGGSADYDIAVLKVTDESKDLIKNSNLSAVNIKNSTEITVGEQAIVIGNPEADGISTTIGIVSVDSEYIQMTNAKNKSVASRVIRIDAAVNGGNSGGGLFDIDGKLMGIVNAKIVSDEVENIGYAIPADIATAVADRIIKYCNNSTNKQMKKASLGIYLKSIYSSAVYNGIKAEIKETIAIDSINTGSIAEGKFEANTVISQIIISSTNSDDTTFQKTIDVTRMYTVVDSSLYLNVGDTITFKLKDLEGNSLEDVTITITEEAFITID